MKHNRFLEDFVKSYININDTRLQKARRKVSPTDGALTQFIKNNLGCSVDFAYQGSFAYHTIIKPHKDNDDGKYDVDLAIKLNYNEDWDGEEKKYHQILIDMFKESDQYKGKLDLSKERAVRIQYDSDNGEFYVDLVPMFNKDNVWNIINRKDNTVEISGGSEFRDWVNNQDNRTSIEGSNKKYLKQVIRIYKFLRNEGFFHHIRSVQLTLLLARQVDKLKLESFVDLSSSLYYITKSLNAELDCINNLSALDLRNPGLPRETFDRNFNQEQFEEFKGSIVDLSNMISDAFIEEDEENSIKLWKEIFGDKFGDGNKIGTNQYVLANYNHAEMPARERRPEVISIKIKGTYQRKGTSKFDKPKAVAYKSGRRIMPASLKFYAQLPKNLGDLELYWQVTNENNQIVENKRGEIGNESLPLGYVKNHKGYGISESGVRKGTHRVKCYLILNNKVIVGESEKFYVTIM